MAFRHGFFALIFLLSFGISLFGEAARFADFHINEGFRLTTTKNLVVDVPPNRAPRGENLSLKIYKPLFRGMMERKGLPYTEPEISALARVIKLKQSPLPQSPGYDFQRALTPGGKFQEVLRELYNAKNLAISSAAQVCPHRRISRKGGKTQMTAAKDLETRTGDDERDAIMHYVFSGLVSFQWGVPLAKGYLVAREAKTRVGPDEIMDLNNNEASFANFKQAAIGFQNRMEGRDDAWLIEHRDEVNRLYFQEKELPYTGQPGRDVPRLARALAKEGKKLLGRQELVFILSNPKLTCDRPADVTSVVELLARVQPAIETPKEFDGDLEETNP